MKTSEILIEALEYIREFKDAVFVVKLGGEVLVDADVVETVAKDLAFLGFVGIKCVVVHGGGKRISTAMEEAGKKPVFVGGLRVTDAETIRIAEEVLNEVNREIAATIKGFGVKAASISGRKEGVFEVVKKEGEVDLGFVGEIVKTNPGVIEDYFSKAQVPIVSPIGVGSDGKSYNINADTAAAALAKALKADKIILLTNVQGVLDKDGKLIRRLTLPAAKKLVSSDAVSGGMIPKLRACIKALEHSVSKAHIVKASRHALLEEILTREGTGTMITKS
ncbi:MAG: acetylglutamate kinase [Candidatus Altiarchaeota archaeon]